MKHRDWHAWLWQYGLPLGILVASLPVVGLLMNVTGNDLDMVWVFVVIPVLSFLSALVVRPVHVWVVPAIAVTALVMFFMIAVYAFPDGATQKPNPLELLLLLVFFAGGPMMFLTWAGRELGERWHHHDHTTPKAPAS